MVFFEFMFWFTLAGLVIQAVLCCADHPRETKPSNLGTDIVLLIGKIALAVFFWGYIFGGWKI